MTDIPGLILTKAIGVGEVELDFKTNSLPIIDVELGEYKNKRIDERVIVTTTSDSAVVYQNKLTGQIHVCTPDEFIRSFHISLD